MSTVIALIAKDGIVVAADGRALGWDAEPLTEEAKKLFEVLPDAACSFAGGVPSDDELHAFVTALGEHIRNTRKQHPIGIEELTTIARDALGKASTVNYGPGSNWLCDYTVESGVIVLLAGYDKHGPAIRVIPSYEKWIKQGAPRRPYVALGAGMQLANEVLDAEFTEDEPLRKANILVLKALYNSYNAKASFRGKEIEPVGGQAQLWNILPKGKIKKFSTKKIGSIYRRGQ